MLRDAFRGTTQLARFILRRDRVQLPVWLVAIVALTVGVTASFPSLYPTPEERAIMAVTMENPAVVAMIGPIYGVDDYTYGAMTGNQMLLFMVTAVAVVNILLVIRHTRSDEEHGRIEVIRSLPVGRLAGLGATLLVVGLANVAVALLTGLGLFALGIESIDFAGSMLFGVAMGATGIAFAAVTALFAQLTETSRGATGLSFAALGLAYLVRAVGDVSSETLARLSPLGLILRTEVYVRNLWWPVWVTLGVAAVVAGLAFYLNALRDLGAGFLRARPGREHATKFLGTPFGLAARLQRTSFIAWAVALFVLGAAYGSVFGDLDAFFESSEMIKMMLPEAAGFSLGEQFTALVLAVMAMFTAVPVALLLLKLGSEERAWRVDTVLAAAVSRRRLLLSYVTLAFLASVLMQGLCGLGFWLASSAAMEEPFGLGQIAAASFVYLPAIWVMLGLAVLLLGWWPKGTGLIWLYIVYSFFVVYLGDLLRLPDGMKRVTPFSHVPQLPVDAMEWGAVAVLTLLALVATALGVAGYRRRDIGV